MREIRTLRATWRGWRRGMVEIVGHSQTKGRDNREPKLRPKPARQSSTLPVSGMCKRSQGRTNLVGIFSQIEWSHFEAPRLPFGPPTGFRTLRTGAHTHKIKLD